MLQHSRYSPSSMAGSIICPSSNPSARGTRIHKIAEELLSESVTYQQCEQLVKEDMVDYNEFQIAVTFANYCKSLQCDNSVAELRTDLTDIESGQFGHVDFAGIHLFNQTLHIVDLKTGFIEVSATDNAQLILYSHGALKYFRNKGVTIDNVVMHIFQHNDTKGYRIDVADPMTPKTVQTYIDSVVIPTIAKMKVDNPERNISPTNCLYCDGAMYCDKLLIDLRCKMNQAGSMMEELNIAMEKNASDEGDFGELYTELKDIAKFVKIVEKVMYQKLLSGIPQTGYKVVESRPHKIWDETDSKLLGRLKRKLGVDVALPRKLLSPAQFKKLVTKEDYSKFSNSIVNPKGSPTIAPLKDKRPEMTNDVGIEIFGDVSECF